MSGELKPCPWCGSTKVRVTVAYDVFINSWTAGVRCAGCRCDGPNAYETTEDNVRKRAIYKWNTMIPR